MTPPIKVHVVALVRRRIGAVGLSRTAIVRLNSWLYDQLEHHSENHKSNRAPGRPDCFQLRKTLLDGGVTYKFVFAVDDQQPGDLFVRAVRYGMSS